MHAVKDNLSKCKMFCAWRNILKSLGILWRNDKIQGNKTVFKKNTNLEYKPLPYISESTVHTVIGFFSFKVILQIFLM